MGCLAHVVTSAMMAVQLAVAAVIIYLVASKLNTIHVGVEGYSAQVTDTCLLGKTTNGASLCIVAYAFSAGSLLGTLALSILLCCTCNLCGLGFLLDTIFALAGTVWWAAAGLVFGYYNKQPAIAQLPQSQARRWVYILSWVGCAAFGLTFLVRLYQMLSAVCSCCGGGRGRSRRKDVEAPPAPRAPRAAPQPVYFGAGPPPGYPGRDHRQPQFIAQ